MGFIDKLDAMSDARATADQTFTRTLAAARDAYVLAQQSHADTERQWLGSLTDDGLRDAAQDSWRAVVASRKALTDTVTTATATREAALEAAWATIKGST